MNKKGGRPEGRPRKGEKEESLIVKGGKPYFSREVPVSFS